MQKFFTFLLNVEYQYVKSASLAREREHIQKPTNFAPSQNNFQKKFGK